MYTYYNHLSDLGTQPYYTHFLITTVVKRAATFTSNCGKWGATGYTGQQTHPFVICNDEPDVGVVIIVSTPV